MKRIIIGLLGFILGLAAMPASFANSLSDQAICKDARYTCIRVQRGQDWVTLFPDRGEREVVMRLNRMDTPLYRGMIIAVPNDLQHTTVADISPFAVKIPAPGAKTIIVDPAVYAWGAYDGNGNLLRWGPVSMGRAYCPDIGRGCRTVTGEFYVYRKEGPNCESTKFPVPDGGAPMPYCMYFHGGYALHASNEVPGFHASHGCARMFYDDAQWLNLNFVDLPNASNDYKGTRVIIKPYPN